MLSSGPEKIKNEKLKVGKSIWTAPLRGSSRFYEDFKRLIYYDRKGLNTVKQVLNIEQSIVLIRYHRSVNLSERDVCCVPALKAIIKKNCRKARYPSLGRILYCPV